MEDAGEETFMDVSVFESMLKRMCDGMLAGQYTFPRWLLYVQWCLSSPRGGDICSALSGKQV